MTRTSLPVADPATAESTTDSISRPSRGGSSLLSAEAMFPNNLGLYRRNRRFTQRQFADVTHLSRVRLSLWETGRGLPNMKEAVVLMGVLKVTLMELYPTRAHRDLIAST